VGHESRTVETRVVWNGFAPELLPHEDKQLCARVDVAGIGVGGQHDLRAQIIEPAFRRSRLQYRLHNHVGLGAFR
jgi:hypothetical protein